MRAVLICGDLVGSPGGAGAVTKHELLALKQVHGEDQVGTLQLPDIRPQVYNGLDLPFLWDYFALAQLREPRFDDLIHAHFYSGSFSQSVCHLKDRGVKVTFTSPSHDRYASKKERELRGGQYLAHIDDDALWDHHKLGLLKADMVISPSFHSAAFLHREGVQKVKVIPHGIETVPQTIQPFPEEFTVGYLGGLGPDKGVIYLIDAWGHLNYPNARLVIAGYDSQEIGPYIQRIAGAGKFTLLGYVEDVADFYNAITVYCQPSVCEGFGIEVLEAMSYGRPVICSVGAGAADLVTEETGWQVKAANTEALLGGIRESLASGLADLKGQSAQKRAAKYTWENMRKEYELIFREDLKA